jgi:hypothetical protein
MNERTVDIMLHNVHDYHAATTPDAARTTRLPRSAPPAHANVPEIRHVGSHRDSERRTQEATKGTFLPVLPM